MRARVLLSFAFVTPFLGCSEDVGHPGGDPGGTGAGGGGSNLGTAITVAVPETERVYLDLSAPAVITPADAAASTAWDVALTGYDVLTNSGPSGPGKGSAFGPLDVVEMYADTAPSVPFLSPDTTGGAFLDWWKYDNAEHVIWSRYHIYGVKDGPKLWKVQVLSFYGEQQGAPVSGLYKIRYAEVTESGAGPVQTLTDIDGTAGGPSPADNVPSDCLDLASGSLIPLTPSEALASKAWHLCFRRNTIRVNGEYGGPKGVVAVDIDADKTDGETVAVVKAKTAESELPRLESIDHAALAAPALVYRGDLIVTAFSDLWVLPGSPPKKPREASWLVVGADGRSKSLLVFDRFDDPKAASPGNVTMRVKAVH